MVFVFQVSTMYLNFLLLVNFKLSVCPDLSQPSEEKGSGAQAMVDDGLYDPTRHNVPIPDIVLG